MSGYKEADMRYHDTHPATLYVLAPLWHMASDGPSSYVVLTENVQIVLNKIVQCNEICCCLLNSIWEVYDVIVCMSSTSERAFIHCRHLAGWAAPCCVTPHGHHRIMNTQADKYFLLHRPAPPSCVRQLVTNLKYFEYFEYLASNNACWDCQH